MRTTIFLAILLGTVIAASQALCGDPAILDEIRGDGSWKTDGITRRSAQQWSLNLQRSDDGTLSGVITASGSPLFSAGRVNGKLDGSVITGTITDEQDQYVARFNGVLSRSGFRGKYEDRTGETGEWEWEGELPDAE